MFRNRLTALVDINDEDHITSSELKKRGRLKVAGMNFEQKNTLREKVGIPKLIPFEETLVGFDDKFLAAISDEDSLDEADISEITPE